MAIERRESTTKDGRKIVVIVDTVKRLVLCVDPDTCFDTTCSTLYHPREDPH